MVVGLVDCSCEGAGGQLQQVWGQHHPWRAQTAAFLTMMDLGHAVLAGRGGDALKAYQPILVVEFDD